MKESENGVSLEGLPLSLLNDWDVWHAGRVTRAKDPKQDSV
jgi:hypothetical protein